jgi:hypothetical protein
MRSINKIMIMAGLVGLTATACQKVDFGDVNESKDVRDSRIPSTDKLFTNIILSTVNFSYGTNIGVEPCLYVQYLMESQYTEGSRYATTNADWAGLYSGPLKDLDKIVKLNTDPASASAASVTANGSNANQIATARIIKAFLYSVVADRWGDVPYTKALNGEVNLTPAYDKQQDVYFDLLKELKEAVAQYDNGAGIKGDPIYNGSVAKWKKLGNSLRMILALRIVKADATKSRTEFLDAFNNVGGYIAVNADNFVFDYPDLLNFRTPWNALYDKRDDYGLSKFFVDYLISTNDLRLTAFAQRNRNGSYVGIPYGLDRNATIAFTGATDYSRMGEPITGRTKNGNTDINLRYSAKGYVITAAQMLSSVAEAAARGWVTSSAATAYNDAITASWDQWGLTYTPAQLNTYLNGASITLAGQSATEVLKRIATQRWVVLYPNGSEAWSEWRRTGFPVLTPAPQAVNASRQIPRRYGYPLNEPLANPTNYAAAVAGIGGVDGVDVKVWWDK